MKTLLRLAVAAALAATLLAQTDWTGSWKNAEMQLTLHRTPDGHKGTILFGGRSLPLTATPAGDRLQGTFTADGARFSFALERSPQGAVTLTSDGTPYLLDPVPSSTAPNPLARPASPPPPPSGLTGDWQGPQGLVRFNPDGTAIIAGQTYRYTLQATTLTLIANDGQVPLPYQLNGNTLSLGAAGQAIQLTRLPANPAPAAAPATGGILPELIGKWCYLANVYATNGGARSSSQCFTLNPDGTYQFYGETGSSNPFGSSASSAADEGAWTATATTITAHSRLRGTTTYRLEKRNHPKNSNDPMLVLDGQAFVTAYQKPPWR